MVDVDHSSSIATSPHNKTNPYLKKDLGLNIVQPHRVDTCCSQGGQGRLDMSLALHGPVE